jgi:Bacterial toxin homologue of phage lysozyme, C-term
MNAIFGEVYLGEYSGGSPGDVGAGGTSLIAQHENGAGGPPSTTGYTIAGTVGANSGVTISSGFDLGVHSAAEITAMGQAIGLSAGEIADLVQFANQKGPAASAALQNFGAPTITSTQALAIQNYQIDANTATIASAYDAAAASAGSGLTFSQLPSQAQTVLVDLSFPQGLAGIEGTQLFQQMVNGQWSAASANLANYGAHGPSAAALNARAAADGTYMNTVPANSFPTPTPKK